MDINLLIAVILVLILIILAIEYDDGFILFIMGFLNIGIVLNLDSLFGITNISYNNFGGLLQLIYSFISIFCFAKIIMSARQDGLLSFGKSHHERK